MSERQHTLVGCDTCGNVCPQSRMVSVGDDWLCTQCAGAEIGRLRQRGDEAVTLHLEAELRASRLASVLKPFTIPLEAYNHEFWMNGSYNGMKHPVPVHWLFKAQEELQRAALGKEQP